LAIIKGQSGMMGDMLDAPERDSIAEVAEGFDPISAVQRGTL